MFIIGIKDINVGKKAILPDKILWENIHWIFSLKENLFSDAEKSIKRSALTNK